MKRRALLALAVAPLLPGLIRPAGAQSIHPGNWQQYLRIESEAGKDKKGRDTISGYIYNVRGQSNAQVRLLIESLDAGGQPIASQIFYVDDVIPIFNRTYFEMRPKTPGSSYRVSIHSGDWTRAVGGV